jgi:hypothetical protein
VIACLAKRNQRTIVPARNDAPIPRKPACHSKHESVLSVRSLPVISGPIEHAHKRAALSQTRAPSVRSVRSVAAYPASPRRPQTPRIHNPRNQRNQRTNRTRLKYVRHLCVMCGEFGIFPLDSFPHMAYHSTCSARASPEPDFGTQERGLYERHDRHFRIFRLLRVRDSRVCRKIRAPPPEAVRIRIIRLLRTHSRTLFR